METRVAQLRADRVPFVHAKVVRAERPTSAKPGDEAVVFADGTIEGFVGGTCAESTVRAQSLTLLDSGDPLLLRISATADVVAAAEQDGTVSVHNPCLSGGTLEIFLDPVVPAPLLLVRGGSPIARALVDLGLALGWQAQATDDNEPSAGLPDDVAALVVAMHGRGDEEAALVAALAAHVPYVGLVASRKRGDAVLAALPVDESERSRVHVPTGLDIGARTPQEVALSILAEVVAERRRHSGRPVEADNADPATAVDPVCGMTVAAVDESLHLDHDGSRYWFCGSGCLRAFAADPAGSLSA